MQMKKILVFTAIVFFALKTTAQLPEISTASDPIWYYLQVMGTDSERMNRVFTAENGSDVYGKPMADAPDDSPEMDKQLWRFEQNGSNYDIINKATGKKLNIAYQSALSLRTGALSDNPVTSWELVPYNGKYLIKAADATSSIGGDATEIYAHQANNYNNVRNYRIMFVNTSWYHEANSLYQFVRWPAPKPSDIVSKTPLWNPDRGLHQEVIYQVYDDKVMEVYGDHEVYPAGFMYDKNVQFQSAGDSITIIQYYLYLSTWIDEYNISAAGLSQIQRMFDALRSEGVKAILRFAYVHDHTPSAYNYPNSKPVYMRLINQLNQLKPIVEANTDVISCWEIGMVGTWGEWNAYYSTAENIAFMKKMIDMMPENQQMMARYVWIKDNFVSQYPQYKNRIGYHDDYFTAGTPSASGQISDFVVGKPQFTKIADESFDVRFHAEIPYNENSVYGFNILIDPAQLLFYLKSFHAQSLDITQNFELNITAWKTTPITPSFLSSNNIFFDESYFLNAGGEQEVRSLYDFVRDHLGYRLNLLPSSSVTFENGQINYDLKLTNTGFGTVLNPSEIYLLVLDNGNNIVAEEKLNVNAKSWQPWAKNDATNLLTHSLSGSIAIASSGEYRIGLWIPDAHASLKNNPAYSIKIAADNGMVTHWTNGDATRTINLITSSTNTGINDSRNAVADPVVEVRYYNLQGQAVRQPVAPGIYVARNLHASGKIAMDKKLVIEK
jgi:hypothetical protein